MTRAAALSLTLFTGFTGLVYQVTWQKYLATLLGSHSEATAAVLGIFLGGLSVGYSLFGVVTSRIVGDERVSDLPRIRAVLCAGNRLDSRQHARRARSGRVDRSAQRIVRKRSSQVSHDHAGVSREAHRPLR